MQPSGPRESSIDLAAFAPLVHGRTWEEMPLGFTFRTASRTITDADVHAFVTLVGLNEPLFLDARVAADAGTAADWCPA
jgi:hypothetical protein